MVFYNRAPFDNLRMSFGDESTIILSGINGSGKTTVISHIVDAFYELARKAYSNEFEDKENKYYRVWIIKEGNCQFRQLTLIIKLFLLLMKWS